MILEKRVIKIDEILNLIVNIIFIYKLVMKVK